MESLLTDRLAHKLIVCSPKSYSITKIWTKRGRIPAESQTRPALSEDDALALLRLLGTAEDSVFECTRRTQRATPVWPEETDMRPHTAMCTACLAYLPPTSLSRSRTDSFRSLAEAEEVSTRPQEQELFWARWTLWHSTRRFWSLQYRRAFVWLWMKVLKRLFLAKFLKWSSFQNV